MLRELGPDAARAMSPSLWPKEMLLYSELNREWLKPELTGEVRTGEKETVKVMTWNACASPS